jgi:hypothetical protein
MKEIASVSDTSLVLVVTEPTLSGTHDLGVTSAQIQGKAAVELRGTPAGEGIQTIRERI